MIIGPAKSKEFLKLIDENLQVQQAGIDVTVAEVHEFTSAGTIDLDNTRRVKAETRKLEWGEDGMLHLKPGPYRIVLNEHFRIPADVAGIMRPRSTLSRNGAALATAVWDPGYEGRSEVLLVVFNPHGLNITKDARIGQILFFRMEEKAEKLYEGAYQKENL